MHPLPLDGSPRTVSKIPGRRLVREVATGITMRAAVFEHDIAR
jgi:hypothetical protein